MTANNIQVEGSHYKNKAIQPWDYITSNNIGYLEGNIIKYVSRWKDKGGVNDLLKAKHYIEKLIELQPILPAKEDARIEELMEENAMLRTHINQGIQNSCGFFCALPECAREQQESKSF